MYDLWRKIFGNLKVFRKMLMVGVVTLISMILLSFILLSNQKEVMLKEKKVELVNIIDVSYSVIQREYDRFKEG